MKIINLDASKWKTCRDFYDAILPALGAPDWHGDNANALVESIVWGEINSVGPPYTVQLSSTMTLPADVAEEITWVKEGVEEGRAEFRLRKGHDVDVNWVVVS